MESIAEQLVGQMLGEKQVYLDNARLKHGVPRHDQPVVIAQPDSPQQQSVVDSIRNRVPDVVPAKSSLMKTAAMLAVSAAAGAFWIPPIVTALAGKAIAEKVVPPPQRPEES